MSAVSQQVRVHESAHQRFLNRKHFGALDGLRAVSVIAVIWHHAAGSSLDGLLGRGDLGVDFFFAISGFLITTLLVREYAAKGKINLRQFYLRRTLRIFPLYYAVIAAYVVLTLALQRGAPEGQAFIGNLPAFLTYTSNWFVTDHGATFFLAWSLATEEQFYLLWPALLVGSPLLTRGRTVAAGLVLAALMVADIVATVALTGDSLLLTMLTSVATPICVGAILALVLNTKRGFQTVGTPMAWKHSALILTAAAVALAAVGASNIIVGVVMALAVASFCTSDRQSGSNVLSGQPLKFVGDISYGMYLLHVLVMNVVERALHVGNGPLLFVATLALTLPVAWASSRFFETPIRNLGRRQTTGSSSASSSM